MHVPLLALSKGFVNGRLPPPIGHPSTFDGGEPMRENRGQNLLTGLVTGEALLPEMARALPPKGHNGRWIVGGTLVIAYLLFSIIPQ